MVVLMKSHCNTYRLSNFHHIEESVFFSSTNFIIKFSSCIITDTGFQFWHNITYFRSGWSSKELKPMSIPVDMVLWFYQVCQRLCNSPSMELNILQVTSYLINNNTIKNNRRIPKDCRCRSVNLIGFNYIHAIYRSIWFLLKLIYP